MVTNYDAVVVVKNIFFIIIITCLRRRPQRFNLSKIVLYTLYCIQSGTICPCGVKCKRCRAITSCFGSDTIDGATLGRRRPYSAYMCVSRGYVLVKRMFKCGFVVSMLWLENRDLCRQKKRIYQRGLQVSFGLIRTGYGRVSVCMSCCIVNQHIRHSCR